jgi:hypothetical protein
MNAPIELAVATIAVRRFATQNLDDSPKLFAQHKKRIFFQFCIEFWLYFEVLRFENRRSSAITKT